MSLTYTWAIDRIGRKSSSTIQNAIVQTHWKLTGTNEDGVSGTFVGATPFDLATVDPNNFVPYEDLTEEIVLGWIQSVVNSNQEYRDHIDIVNGLERFYGDETLANLLRHSKALVEECQSFQRVLKQEEEEYAEEEN